MDNYDAPPIITQLSIETESDDDFYPELDGTDEMGGLQTSATREFTVVMVFIIGLLIFGIIALWKFTIPIWIQIPVTIILLLSLYYQIMIFKLQLTMPTLIMNLTDRLWNETVYQIEKRGYEVTFRVEERDEDCDKMIIKHSNVPKNKKPYIKALILLNTILTPAWRYRDGYEWDDRIIDEEDD